jgi:hypothetical protein
MPNGLAQTERGTAVLQPVQGGVKEIPYDYVATFTLEGIPGTRLQDVINISIEGAFIATAIGYSFLPLYDEPDRPDPRDAVIPAPSRRRDFLRRARERLRQHVEQIDKAPPDAFLRLAAPFYGRALWDVGLRPDVSLIECLARRFCGIDFLYSIIDSGSGRELQNKMIHNIAGLGEPHGERPFRPFAKPMVFQPRSTIRIEVIEQSAGHLFKGGTLYIVLHGYKILGSGTEVS